MTQHEQDLRSLLKEIMEYYSTHHSLSIDIYKKYATLLAQPDQGQGMKWADEDMLTAYRHGFYEREENNGYGANVSSGYWLDGYKKMKSPTPIQEQTGSENK